MKFIIGLIILLILILLKVKFDITAKIQIGKKKYNTKIKK